MAIGIILLFIIGALLAWLRKNDRIAKTISLAVTLGATVLAIFMTNSVLIGGAQKMSYGEGIFRVSMNIGILECFMACLFGIIGFLIVWASTSMVAHDVEKEKIPLFYGLVLALLGTLNAVVFFDSLLCVLIAIELSSFAAAGIVMVKNQPETLRAGLKYLSLSILGSSLVLMGMIALYTMTQSLNMGEIGQALRGVGFMEANGSSVLWAFGLVTIGVAFKSALFPCHIWLPDAHGTAPSPSSAMLSSLVLKAYIVFYIKMMFEVVGFELIANTAMRNLMNVVMVVGVVAMICGSLLAIMQTDIKRMIAYSSVAQMGYIFMGIGIGTELGLFAALFHILTHAVTKSALFLVAGSIIEQTHNRRLDKMGGIGMLMPLTMGLFTVGGLSMIGIPLLVGFNSKWNFSMAIMDSGNYWLLIPLSISALLNALYYLPVVIRAFFGQEAKENAKQFGSKERKLVELLPIIILTCFVVFFGVYAG
ncbi:MAG: proton-conducting transporter membrane subunit, partial [Clostridiales bacterium]|nr:proton-conducting transporter membrane subunit [Clostridiales bacterium]